MTYRKKKKFKKDTKRYTLHKHAQRSLGLGSNENLELACQTPDGESFEEWMAVNIIDFYNKVCIIIQPLEKKLAEDKTESMGAGEHEYYWKGGKYKKPTMVKPFEYINLALDMVEGYVNDPSVFPAEDGATFPSGYKRIIRDIFKKMFRILAHLMLEKCSMLVEGGLIAHANTIFKHMIMFIFVHRLMKPKEVSPMNTWVEKNMGKKYLKYLKKKRKKKK